MKKKLLSLIMAVAMIASMAVPALAQANTATLDSESGTYKGSMAMDGAMRAATIQVTLPNTKASKLILNPYQLQLTTTTSVLSGDSYASALTATAGSSAPQVISAPLEIKSESDVPLKVGLSVTATPSEGINMATENVSGTEKAKKVFLYFEMVKKDAAGTRITADASTGKWGETDEKLWHSDPNAVNINAYSQLIATNTGKGTAENLSMIMLPAQGDNNGTPVPAYVYFKAMGSATSAPTKDWTTTDKVDLALAFTFAPTVIKSVSLQKIKDDGTYGPAGTGDKPTVTEANAAPGTAIRVEAPKGSNGTTKIISGLSVVSVEDENVTVPVTQLDTDGAAYYFTMPTYDVYVRFDSIETI